MERFNIENLGLEQMMTDNGSFLQPLSSTRKLPSSRYKGVVPQPNGKWGAQIYDRHLRIWLGTFRTELEAALAHDVAALKFRGEETTTNFTDAWKDHHQAWFLRVHSREEIVEMVRRNTYHEELSTAREEYYANGDGDGDGGGIPLATRAKCRPARPVFAAKREMFDKVLTPSDVGKLNRLVIPKHHAEKFLPLEASRWEGCVLSLEDEGGRVWRIKYSYWSSSQSYVLTSGWRAFVKEKRLKEGDVVTFLRSVGPEAFYYIACKRGGDHDCGRNNGVIGSGLAGVPSASSKSEKVGGQSLRLFGVDLDYTTACSCG